MARRAMTRGSKHSKMMQSAKKGKGSLKREEQGLNPFAKRRRK